MHTYYIKEIDFNKINKDKLVTKLKKKLLFRETTDLEIITPSGIVYMKDDEYYKKKINYNNAYMMINFENFTLLRQYSKFYYTKEKIWNIPVEHKSLIIKKMKFYLSEKTKTAIILEFCNDKFIDLYFVSDQTEENISLKDDIRYFAQLIL
jgi:hypothetical protein